MSQNSEKNSSTSERAKPDHARNASFGMNWQSVKRYVETVMPSQAGVVCVDLDSVILFHDSADSRLGRVLPLGRKLINLLRKSHCVVVLTARAKNHQGILTFLHKNNVWVDQVTNRKPYADAYFDDKGVPIPKNWRLR